MRVSTLERIANALDGDLELTAKLKSGRKVVLMGLTGGKKRLQKRTNTGSKRAAARKT